MSGWAATGFCGLLSHLVLGFFPFQANIGQKEDFEAARKKALALGAKKVKVSLPAGAQGALSSPCHGAEALGSHTACGWGHCRG